MAHGFESMMNRIDSLEQELRSAPTLYARMKTVWSTSAFKMSPLPDHQVDQFLTTCVRRRCYHCAITAAAHFQKVEQVLMRMPYMGWQFWHGWLAILLRLRAWAPVRQILLYFYWHAFSELLRVVVVCLKDDEGLDEFQILLNRCFQTDVLLLDVVRVVSVAGQIHKFRILLQSKNEHVRQAVYNVAATIYLPIIRQRYSIRKSSLEKCRKLNDCLSAALEAGLFTTDGRNAFHQTSTFAVENLMRDVVLFLYSAGVIANDTVSQLNRNQKLCLYLIRNYYTRDTKQLMLDVDFCHAVHMKHFLFYAASRPRSLRVLSLLEVSKHVGWGHVREPTVDQLVIPYTLKHQLKFKGCRGLLKP